MFLTLRIFSATGGIEKVCRVVGKALYENNIESKGSIRIFSMYDTKPDAYQNLYFPLEIFRGFGKNKIAFTIKSFFFGLQSDTIIISHINLLIVGWLIKKVRPQKKVVLFAHGIEVWSHLSYLKRKMILSCDVVLPVSHYTLERLIHSIQIKASVCKVVNNCLDPYMPLVEDSKRVSSLKEKYGIQSTDKILFTLCRLSSKERYKGYDKVIRSLPQILLEQPNLKYILAGSFDEDEKKYLDNIIKEMGVSDVVIFTGFVSNEDLVAHFLISDLYIMPSIKEGFGIVFVEAMCYGLPVIAGNRDGSVDALLNGELGLLIDPLDVDEITNAIKIVLDNKDKYIPSRNIMMENFSYEVYKNKLHLALS